MALVAFFWDPSGIVESFFHYVTRGMGLADPYGILLGVVTSFIQLTAPDAVSKYRTTPTIIRRKQLTDDSSTSLPRVSELLHKLQRYSIHFQ